MANKNKNLNDAAKAKKDEFYTQLEDIERELRHEEYRNFFKGKTILCNCDDPYESEFFKYFAMNFNALSLKKLIVTCYAGSPVAQTELNFDFGGSTDKKHRNEYAYKVVINEFKDWNGDGREDLEDIKHYILTHNGCWERLQGNGDFRSAECIEILKEADVVVTNPPFSLFREYVAQLVQYKKFFVIIGNINSITYKEIFPLIQQNKIHIGYGMGRAVSGFMVPEYYSLHGTEAGINSEGKRIVATNQCLWYTNIPLKKYLEEIPLVCSYYENPEKYPKYDNYDAIEVSKTAQIPYDYLPDKNLTNTNENDTISINQSINQSINAFAMESWACQSHSSTGTTQINSRLSVALTSTETPASTLQEQVGIHKSTARTFTSGSSFGGRCNGVMGVPITFLDKYNPRQFEIVGATESEGKGFSNGLWIKESGIAQPVVNGERKYKRIFIKRKM